jgi:hypothetical protein
MTPEKERVLDEGLERYFGTLSSTRTLLSDLVRRREHPVETLILLCARLDALASDSSAEGIPSKQAFRRFLEGYSGQKKLFESVSVGDLYYELLGHVTWRHVTGWPASPGATA